MICRELSLAVKCFGLVLPLLASACYGQPLAIGRTAAVENLPEGVFCTHFNLAGRDVCSDERCARGMGRLMGQSP